MLVADLSSELVEQVLNLGSFFQQVHAHNRGGIVGRKEVHVVLEQDQVQRGDAAVSGRRDAHIGIAVRDGGIQQPDLDVLDITEAEPVGLFQTLQAIGADGEFMVRGKRHVTGHIGEVADLRDAGFLRELTGYDDRERVVEAPGLQPLDVELLGISLGHDLVGRVVGTGGWRRFGRRGRFRQFLAKDGDKAGAGIFHVGVEVASNESFMGDDGAAQVHLALDTVSGIFQQVCENLADDELLGEILRADGYRGLVILCEATQWCRD